MKILVTGAAGYLGSILCRSLLEKGYEVRGIDAGWYGTEQIKECINHENFEYIEKDIRNLTSIVKALKNIDGVIHLASIVECQLRVLNLELVKKSIILLQRI